MDSYRTSNKSETASTRDSSYREKEHERNNRFSSSDSYNNRDNRGDKNGGYHRERDVKPSSYNDRPSDFSRHERREEHRDNRRDDYRDNRRDDNRDNRREDHRDNNRRDDRREYGDDRRREREFDRVVDSRERDRSGPYPPKGEENLSKKHHDSLLTDPVTVSDPDKSPDTIYISNLPQSVTDSSLARFFGTVGIIKNDKKTGNPKVWIYKDKSTGLPKGDATVTFEDPSASDGAISWFDGKVFEGKTIKVEKAQAIKPPPGGWNARRGGGGGRGGGRGGGGRGRW